MSVATLITDAKVRTDSFVDAARDALSDAVSAAEAIRFGGITPSTNTLPPAPTIAPLIAPTLPAVTLEVPPNPGVAPTYQDIDEIDINEGKPTAFAKSAPITVAPMKPAELAAFSTPEPTLSLNVNWPTAPVNIAYDAPSMKDRAEPGKAVVVVPKFDSIAPGDAPAPITPEQRKEAGIDSRPPASEPRPDA